MIPEPIHDIEVLAASKTCINDVNGSPRPLLPIFLKVLVIPVFIFVIFLCGFFVFILSLDRQNSSQIKIADGIVALTGGSDRIGDAVELLAGGRANRLLISGVNPSTSTERLSQLVPQRRELFSCCIDLDRAAYNTVSNAIETRRWVEARQIKTLIVVTSDYHMPRAMIELQRAMPNIKLFPHPATPENASLDFNINRELANTKIVAVEYSKFLASYLRSFIYPTLPLNEISSYITPAQATGSTRKSRFKLNDLKQYE